MRFTLAVLIVICLSIDVPVAVVGDIGSVTSYGPPYVPTKCGGYNQKFPEGGMFAAVSNGLWDNGAACGRRYRMHCISGPNRPCKDDVMIVVEVVDACRSNPCPATIVVSEKAFDAISSIPDVKINVEYAQI